MPTLNWMGKEKVIAHHRDVPSRVLERVPHKGVLDSRGSDCGNMVIQESRSPGVMESGGQSI